MADGTEPIVGEEFDVFISYAHADKEDDSDRSPAQTLAALLEAEGYSVWWDRQLIGGQDWLRELPTKIGFARKVIALVSPRWIASRDCYAEMVRSYETPNKLVPVLIADCALPTPIAHLNAIRAVGNLALAKALIFAALGGLKPSNAPTKSAPSRLSADDIWLEGLPTGTRHLFGRDVELTTLLDAWASGSGGGDPARKTNAVVLHAIGGAGKSALLRRFLDALEEKGFPGAAKVYGWSAYSQGSGDKPQRRRRRVHLQGAALLRPRPRQGADHRSGGARAHPGAAHPQATHALGAGWPGAAAGAAARQRGPVEG